jgi:hypothetical protein
LITPSNSASPGGKLFAAGGVSLPVDVARRPSKSSSPSISGEETRLFVLLCTMTANLAHMTVEESAALSDD